MSHDIGITITFQTPIAYASSLEALESAGWEIRDVTGSSFIREGATDLGDWLLCQPVATEDVREIVATRDGSRQFAGVVLRHGGTLHGCTFLWTDRQTVVISPSINRVKLTGG